MEARFAASEEERVLAEAEECERMEAGLMENATNNAGELIGSLTLK